MATRQPPSSTAAPCTDTPPDLGENAPLLSSESLKSAPWWRLGSERLQPLRDHEDPKSPSQHGQRHERLGSDWTFIGSLWGSGDISGHCGSKSNPLWPSHCGILLKLAFFLSYVTILSYIITICIGPLLLLWEDKADWCPNYNSDEALDEESDKEYDNPDYITDPCRYVRLPRLLGLTLEDCDMSRRMLVSVLLGGAIGYERRSSDRPAGIRTMGLVSLGACFFTISSIMAFKTSTMGWDASRVTAALPSGVGFLGGALIWKGSVMVDDTTEQRQVHGLTTAASLWLSAAIGVGAGGALYFVTLYTTVLVVLVLKYGPRLYLQQDTEYDDDDEDEEEEEEEEVERDRLPKTFSQKDMTEEDTAAVAAFSDSLSREKSVASSLNSGLERPRRRKSTAPTFHS